MKQRIIIADAEETFRTELAEVLGGHDEFEVVGITADGGQAIQLVRDLSPDVLVMDLLLPQYDGLSVLDMISTEHTKCKVFVATSFISNYITTALAARRVACLLQKPCSAQHIASKIAEALHQDGAPIEEKIPGIKLQITEMIHEIGVLANIKGYHYLRDAVKLAAENMDRINNMTEGIYKPVASLHNTTPERVQRAILRAIEIAWDRGDLDTLQRYFGYTVSNTKGRPVNSEVIALLADKIQLAHERILQNG